MRPFEIILVAAVFSSIAACSLAPGTGVAWLPRAAAFALAIAFLFLLLHLVYEGAHWQMFPAYAAMLPAALLAWPTSTPGNGLRWPYTALGLLLLLAACACSYVLPMFRLPAPTGPYAVGTSIVYLVDASRDEPAAPGHKRELMVQLWYPAAPSHNPFAPYRRREETTLMSSYQAVLPTHSRLDAPILVTGSPWPVLVFNPGWRGRRTQNTFLTEELASHGYLVAAIDHTYNSSPVAFPDGRVITVKPTRSIEEFLNTTPAEIEQIGNAETDKDAIDLSFVLDELTRLNQQQGSRWYGAIDAANAGALGHSIGGAVAVQAWATDARIHAAMNMDGWTFGSQVTQGTRAVPAGTNTYPLLFLYEDGYHPAPQPLAFPAGKTTYTAAEIEAAVDADDAAEVRALIRRYGGYWLRLKGSIHPTFIDRTITSPIRRLSGAGPIDPRRAHAIVRDYTVQFFDQELKHKPSALLSGRQTTYPEMVMELKAKAAESVTTP